MNPTPVDRKWDSKTMFPGICKRYEKRHTELMNVGHQRNMRKFISYYYQTNCETFSRPHKNEMSYLFCQSWGDYSREQLEKLMPDMTEWCALNLTAKDIFKMSRTILLSETRFSRYQEKHILANYKL